MMLRGVIARHNSHDHVSCRGLHASKMRSDWLFIARNMIVVWLTILRSIYASSESLMFVTWTNFVSALLTVSHLIKVRLALVSFL